MEGHNNTALYFVATVAFISMVAVNALANLLPINGLNTGEVLIYIQAFSRLQQ